MTDGNAHIVLESAGLTYPTAGQPFEALRDIDLAIDPSSFVAIVGPSGCGKSSLLRLLSGLTHPSKGRVIIDGQPVGKPRQDVGIAFQKPSLLPWRSTRRNILLPLEILARRHRARDKDAGMGVADAHAEVDRLLALVGLAGCGDKHVFELSGGMQQRVSLCRAVIHKPQILLLDEPFGALDAFTREDLWLVLQDVFLERGCTVVMITHDLREAVFLADRIVVMDRAPGRILNVFEVAEQRPRSVDFTLSGPSVDLIRTLRAKIEKVMKHAPHPLV